MKNITKHPILSICSLMLLVSFSATRADTTSDTETILNWAESTYPGLFPTREATQNINPWLFRHYPETGIYAGVNLNDNGVYVLGGPWEEATFIDTLANVFRPLIYPIQPAPISVSLRYNLQQPEFPFLAAIQLQQPR